MDRLSFRDYFREEYFPISVELMLASGTSKTNQGLHTHEFSEIVLMGRGVLTHHTEDSEIRLEKGDFFLIHPGMAHGYSEPSRDSMLYNLIYDSRAPIPILTATDLPFVRNIYPDTYEAEAFGAWSIARVEGKELRNIIDAMERIKLEVRERRPGHHILIASLFMEVVIALSRCFSGGVAGDDSNWALNQVVAFLKCHYREKISMADMSRIARMSESTLFRRFKKAFGIGPGEYLASLRVRQAVALLKKRDMKLESIAHECGFCDSSHLWKALSAKLNKTPAEIRRDHDW